MKKKGFTMIELLATIVIISTISVIATPAILNTIEESKKSAFEQSLNGIVSGAKIYQMETSLKNDLSSCRYFSYGNDVNEVTIRDDKTYYPLKELKFKGKLPTEGELKICDNIITLEVSDGIYSGNYDGNKFNISKGDLASNDFTTPVIDTFNLTATLDRIIVSVLAHSPGIGGVISNYYYKIDDGEYIKTTEKSYIFEKLKPNTEYTISIKVDNKSGIIKEESKKIKTKAFGEITINVENIDIWTTSKKVTLSGTTSEYEIEYKIEKYNPETEENEESGFVTYKEPFVLDTVATALHPTTITVRYSSNGNYSDYKSYSITRIDTTEPTNTSPAVNLSTTKPTSEANVVIRQGDEESGLDESTIEYGYSEEENGTYKWQTSKTLTKLTSGKKYYVKTKVKNNVGQEKESEVKEYTPGTINTCSVTPLTSGWATNKDVSIKGSQEGTELQYQVGDTEDDSWKKIENNGTINVTENTTVYCRLWDGTTAGAYGSGSVNKIDTSEPTITLEKINKTTNSIVITYKAEDSESGINGTTCVYGTSTSYGKTGIVDENTCTISGLNAGTTYYYKIETTNNSGLTKAEVGDTTSGTTSISYSQSQTPTGTTYAQSKEITVKYTIINVTSPTRYIKTSVATTSSVDGYGCGTGTDPGTCGTTATKNLVANTWYKVESNPVITLASNGVIYTRINDGESYTVSSNLNIEKIDTSAPSLTLGTVTKTTNSIIIPITAADEESGISGTTCVYGTSTSYGKTGTVSENACTISSVKSGTTYYYKIVTTNNSGLTKEATGNTETANITNPSIAYTNNPTTAENGYLKSQVIKITYNISNITSPVRYVKTTREGISSLGVTESCGTGTDPGTCTSITSTKTLEANKWYKVSGNVSVTYNVASAETGTIYALTYDGTNYSGASTGTISKIYYNSENISYTNSSNSSVTNVKQALDDLYTKIGG